MSVATMPHHVTRFYGNCEYALDVIEAKRIAFIHASILNDPFDPYAFLETDFGDSYASLLYFVQRNHPADVRWFRTHVTQQSWNQTVTDLREHMVRFRASIFVFCTCAARELVRPESNLYMWTHYANGHRGVAIEFDTNALTRAVLQHSASISGTLVDVQDAWTEMEYAPAFPPITAEQIFQFMKQEMEFASGIRPSRVTTRLEDYYKRMAIVKSNVWQVEKEWRLMWRNDEIQDTVYKCPVGSPSITKVYLGLAVEPRFRERILAASRLHFPQVEILQCRKRHGEFSLQFERP